MKRLILICAAVCAGAFAFAADNNTLSLGSVSTVAGARNVTLSVGMENLNTISDLQFDLLLPDGISVATDGNGNPLISVSAARGGADSRSVSTAAQTDGALRVLCTSSSGTAFTANKGEVLSVSLNIAADISTGEKTVLLKNIVLSSKDGAYTPRNVKGTLTVQPVAVLTFIIDNERISRDTVVVGSPITPPSVREREGYTFSGWGNVPATMPNYDLTLTATFTLNRYAVRFVAGDSVVSLDSLAYGAEITPPAAPQREGYTFRGWGEVDKSVPAHDCTYRAQYVVNTYTLSYWADSVLVRRDSIAYGAAISAASAPQAPQKEGYTFRGWTGLPAAMPARDVECTAAYSLNRYRIAFLIDSTVYAADSLSYGESISLPAAPEEREGYTFLGWGEVDESVPAHDCTYRAQYVVNTYTLSYWADSVLVRRDSIAYGAAISAASAPAAPQKEGYTFRGWTGLPAAMPARDVECVAAYSLNRYRITFLVDDDVYETDSVSFGETVSLPQDPEKDGYAFLGWERAENDSVQAGESRIDEDFVMPAGDVVARALFEQNSVRGDVNEDGVVNSSDAVAIYNYINSGTESGVDTSRADINEDNTVNSSDVVEIYNIVASGN